MQDGKIIKKNYTRFEFPRCADSSVLSLMIDPSVVLICLQSV